ncbi:hypothetical protein CSB37_02660 [bacterium DOLZORAL124_38_8]|nr:MAG: hypothetical protein CSB37_02660 [bacterium DOLZORAL124_38_8]
MNNFLKKIGGGLDIDHQMQQEEIEELTSELKGRLSVIQSYLKDYSDEILLKNIEEERERIRVSSNIIQSLESSTESSDFEHDICKERLELENAEECLKLLQKEAVERGIWEDVKGVADDFNKGVSAQINSDPEGEIQQGIRVLTEEGLSAQPVKIHNETVNVDTGGLIIEIGQWNLLLDENNGEFSLSTPPTVPSGHHILAKSKILKLQPGKTFSIGRKHELFSDNKEDPFMSLNHLTVELDSDGTVLLTDHSTNGTTISKQS